MCVDCGNVTDRDPRAQEARRLDDGFALLRADKDSDVDTDRHIGRNKR